MPTVDMKAKVSKPAPRWDLDPIFPGGSTSPEYKDFRAAIRKDLDKLKESLATLGTVLNDSTAPAWTAAILEFQRLGEHLEMANSFVLCLVSADIADEAAKSIHAEIDVMGADWLSHRNTLEALFAKQNDSDWQKLLGKQELASIKFPLTEMRRIAKEKMSPELEAFALELSVNGYHSWSRFYGILSGEIKVNFEENGKTETLSIGQLQNKFNHEDRDIRRRAFQKFEEAWDQRASLAASALNFQGGFRLSLYKNRGWKSVLHEPLTMNRLREETLNAMWRAVETSFPKMRKYIEAKKKILGIDKFCWYDQFAPVGQLDVEFNFEEAGDFIVKHLGTFSDEMSKFSRMALDKRWIEGEDRPGKRDGGFCTGMNLKGQSRIFMTYSNDFGSMTTLAHELGHGYHQWVLKDTPYLATEYPMGLAETASIFNELRVIDAALQEVSDRRQKLMLMDQVLQQAFTLFCNIYSRFLFDSSYYKERAEGMVSRKRLDELMVQAQKKAFGGTLDPSDGHHPLFWASKLHFFYTEAPFYNYPYTFGFLFAGGVYEQATRQGTAFAPKYRALLEDTGKMMTEEVAAKHLEVDLTKDDFWMKSVDRAMKYVDEFVDLANNK